MALNCSTAFRTRILGSESFSDLLDDGCMRIFSGAPPANADLPEQGALLGVVSVDAKAWRAGFPDWGLRWQQQGEFMLPLPTQAWAFRGIAAGTAGWFRLVGNAPDAGEASMSAIRIDGAIGTSLSPAEMTWGDRTVAPGTFYPLLSVYFALPPVA